MPAEIHVGTSAFTAAGWKGSFYPKTLKPAEYLTYYAQRFNTVEVDSTFYRAPSLATVKGWYTKTQEGFLFAAKVPQTITHDKMLVHGRVEQFPDDNGCLGRETRATSLSVSPFQPKCVSRGQRFYRPTIAFPEESAKELQIRCGSAQQELAGATIHRNSAFVSSPLTSWSIFGAGQAWLGTRKRNRSNDLD